MKKEDCKVGEHYMVVVNGKRVMKMEYLGADNACYAKLMGKAGLSYYPHECLRRIKPKTEKVSISKADLSFAIDSCSPSLLDGIGNALLEKLWRALVDVQGKCREVRWVKRAK
jgi:hypothetical protein